VLTVNRSTGEELFSLPLRFQPYASFTEFGELVPNEPGGIKLGQSGDFVLMIKIGDHIVTRMPFTLQEKPELNPYDPPKKFLREGPWRDLAYFSVPTDDPNTNIDFNWWMTLRELPTGMINPLVAVHLMRGYREIARSRERVAVNSDDWQFFTSDLIQITKSGPQPITLGQLDKYDGDYLMIVEANGQPIKSYSLEVKRGRLQRAEQSRLDFEPHVDFISPRLLDISARPDFHNLMRDLYWVRRTAVTGTFPQRWDPTQPSAALDRKR
jgi:hypothetical protein